jgi:ATF/CREB family transcription factor
LLSQAHQELSKREEEGRGTTPLAGKRTSVGAVPPGSGKIPPSSAGLGQKRKSDTGPTGGTGGKGGKKGKKASEAAMKKDESASPSFSMMEDEDDGEPRMINGRPETEEEKRKNFLERNRQGTSVTCNLHIELTC